MDVPLLDCEQKTGSHLENLSVGKGLFVQLWDIVVEYLQGSMVDRTSLAHFDLIGHKLEGNV